jgi:serine/threonine protein kinase
VSCQPPLKGVQSSLAAFQEYTKAIDVWSIGCILAEMSKSSRTPGWREEVLIGSAWRRSFPRV